MATVTPAAETLLSIGGAGAGDVIALDIAAFDVNSPAADIGGITDIPDVPGAVCSAPGTAEAATGCCFPTAPEGALGGPGGGGGTPDTGI